MPEQLYIHYLEIVKNLNCNRWAEELDEDPNADTLATNDPIEVTCPNCMEKMNA